MKTWVGSKKQMNEKSASLRSRVLGAVLAAITESSWRFSTPVNGLSLQFYSNEELYLPHFILLILPLLW